MIQPPELKLNLPMRIAGNVLSSTRKVWQILSASYKGKLEEVKKSTSEEPALFYAQYNYTPPIHFAVREGHTELVRFLLANGALDSEYRIYPFQESLQTIARDRGLSMIAGMLDEYMRDPSLHRYKGDNGSIDYQRSNLQIDFEKAVDESDYKKAKLILERHPEFAKDETYFWGEGILAFAAKENNREMIDLLMSYGAKIPSILKWTQFYYFEHPEGASYMMEKGMDPNTKSWQEVTILHDMAQKGFVSKAELLLGYGAEINAVDEEYKSTPLGMAVHWGQAEMVYFLLQQGADPNKSGAPWSTPLAWARKKGHHDIEKMLIEAGSEY